MGSKPAALGMHIEIVILDLQVGNQQALAGIGCLRNTCMLELVGNRLTHICTPAAVGIHIGIGYNRPPYAYQSRHKSH